MTPRQYVAFIAATALATGSAVGLLILLLGGSRATAGMYAAVMGVIACFVTTGIAGIEAQLRREREKDSDDAAAE